MWSRRVIGIAAACAALCGSGGVEAAAWRDGAHVYEKVCRYCHEAGVGPVIRGRNLPVEYVQRVVRFGNRAMPAFRPSEIDDASLADVARLISSGTPLAKE
ncbi:cytochrome c [Azoarcus sp. KH32C]|uniref:c-type cytochrome n=1 Tax=Azoarcus sp. KH32C TaxID=748247 RepID=UPI000238651C|nr:c-type cytochrome [Azoarcus sp. KH32C]BAL25219.1 cytochrome c, class I [Azoarcus sp. KH32C]